ncbi:MAG: SMP-30/gluconolactonase/LRE family protein [Caldilineae bacterium]|nr:SMP-30/gluconolactonase/LRE family protein [Anaerolineae bacterium]MCB0203886.1 SMP-30/gluconolactonase/LRE family protein [Anaerolineae bacterium]MCB0255627.1 SMP-30/gluconolactonase/LRE family protein [Anaerolineae bacterium]MCB9140571.1 SMP-30/gluconolactonase/LRE family protein [Caldilineaceae bacterium]MCB9153074.1 SMP-30/gluconolactonase/LRE family protein [Caldilineae bacterium]
MKITRVAVFILVLIMSLTGSVAAGPETPPEKLPTAIDLAGPLQTAPLSPTIDLGQPKAVYGYTRSIGASGMPYLTDGQHLRNPNGIFIDGNGSLYVVEETGYRLLKYNASGVNTLTLGQAGQPWHHDQFLATPKRPTVDAAGNIWVTMDNAVKAFDASGTLLLRFPDGDPWNPGSDNAHFSQPRGIAFDSSGKLYVADRYNHRIQVFTVASNTLTYLETIGVTGVPGSDNAHFNSPADIFVDSNDRLYISDVENFRVQRCTFAGSWTCTTFHGTGTSGSGVNQLSWAYGLGVDSTGNNIYIADSANGRVKKCNTSGICSTFATGFQWPADVAVDSSGAVYISDFWNFTVRKYNSSGSFLGVFAGVAGVPYVTDSQHLNGPQGMAMALDGGYYVAETKGYRLLKYNRNGVQQWAVGQAGVAGSDNAHFGTIWAGPEGSLAVDAAGRVYVPDTGNNRIQVFNPNGTYYRTFGSYGTGNDQFDCPAGVAINPANGYIYVSDKCNQRIQVYTSNWGHRMTLGVVDETGTDNRHFAWPQSIALDSNGVLFVADNGNNRVQKCTLSANDYACATFAGETGVWGDDFGHMQPYAVAVDRSGQVFVADAANVRGQVFDANGVYLTTISGRWGTATGEMTSPFGLAVDSQGAVWVADATNHRVDRYMSGVPGWQQRNVNGFGDRNNHAVWSLGTFGDRLYASTANDASGAELFRLSPNGAWERVANGGFGRVANIGIDRLTEFNGQLYASTWTDGSIGAQIWRSSSGNVNSWSLVAQGGLGSANNSEFMSLTPFNGYLYAASWVWDSTIHGAEIWRSSTGNNGSWTRVVSNGFNNANDNYAILSMKAFNGYLYAATGHASSGGELWRTNDGVNWEQVNANGFGSADNIRIVSLERFGGKLYAGTWNSATGGEIWRSSNGTSWERVMQGGFGNSANTDIGALIVFRNELFVMVGNRATGPGVWRSASGDSGSWRKVMDTGFGSGNALSVDLDNQALVFNDGLYIATFTFGNGGGRLWQYLPERTYLPLLVKM